jgi:hypothetical protein
MTRTRPGPNPPTTAIRARTTAAVARRPVSRRVTAVPHRPSAIPITMKPTPIRANAAVNWSASAFAMAIRFASSSKASAQSPTTGRLTPAKKISPPSSSNSRGGAERTTGRPCVDGPAA